jgi:hypothetical protein
MPLEALCSKPLQGFKDYPLAASVIAAFPFAGTKRLSRGKEDAGPDNSPKPYVAVGKNPLTQRFAG